MRQYSFEDEDELDSLDRGDEIESSMPEEVRRIVEERRKETADERERD